MIGKLTGRLDSTHEAGCILDVNGVGYLLSCSRKTLDALSAREKTGRALRMASIDEIISPFYLRLSLLDKAGVSEGVYRIFSKHKVSIARVIQYEHPHQGRGTVTLSTYPVSERSMSAVLAELRRLKTVLEEPVVLRIFSPES